MKLLKQKMSFWLCLFALFSSPVAAGSWSLPPLNVGPGNTYPRPFSETQQLAVDPSGNVVAVWVDGYAYSETGSPVPGTSIMAATLRYGAKNWSNPVPIQSSSSTIGSLKPSVAVDGLGNAIAVWSLYNHSLLQWNTYYATFDFQSQTWSASTIFSHSTSQALDTFPSVVANSNGQAVAVWQTVLPNNVVAAVFPAPFMNSVPTVSVIETISMTTILPTVAIDDEGNALIVWDDVSGLYRIVNSAYYNGSSFVTPSSSFAGSSNLVLPVVALDGVGNGVVVYQQAVGVNFYTYASTFQGGSWSAPIPLSPASTTGTFPSVAMDGQGKAVAAWTLVNSGGAAVVQAANFSFSSGWSSPYTLSQPGLSSGVPQVNVSIDGLGNAAAVWNQEIGAGVFEVQASLYRNHWQSPSKVTTLSGSSTIFPFAVVSSNAKGNTFALWDENGTVQSSAFDLQLQAPGQFKGKRVENNFLFQSTCSDNLTWNLLPNRSGLVAKYLVYSGKQLIATLPGNTNSLKIPVANCSRGNNYEIIAVSPSGAESSPSFARVTP